MASEGNIFASLIESIKRLLGLSKPESEKLRASIAEWKDKRRTLHDEVDALKAEIRDLQDRVRGKDAELKAAVADPETRPIIEEEIKSLFQQLDLKTRKRDIIFGGLDRMTNLIEQGENVLLGSSTTTVTPETFMFMQLQMGEVLTQLREADRESARLSTMKYHRPTTEVAISNSARSR